MNTKSYIAVALILITGCTKENDQEADAEKQIYFYGQYMKYQDQINDVPKEIDVLQKPVVRPRNPYSDISNHTQLSQTSACEIVLANCLATPTPDKMAQKKCKNDYKLCHKR
ncbi:hypothetical protein [Crenothrix polyspora]|uniref:Lipoprotein n=1 Tax=Crenothrix polyspora TaxID=360316 RepID=A0A1R4HGW3_9GAMM|nr:hypothetical protein [Crenothrix polyspora]SJM95449.1 hypothetical protein CRENPOLYSF1_70012 [Crenothrix polyspora]